MKELMKHRALWSLDEDPGSQTPRPALTPAAVEYQPLDAGAERALSYIPYNVQLILGFLPGPCILRALLISLFLSLGFWQQLMDSFPITSLQKASTPR